MRLRTQSLMMSQCHVICWNLLIEVAYPAPHDECVTVSRDLLELVDEAAHSVPHDESVSRDLLELVDRGSDDGTVTVSRDLLELVDEVAYPAPHEESVSSCDLLELVDEVPYWLCLCHVICWNLLMRLRTQPLMMTRLSTSPLSWSTRSMEPMADTPDWLLPATAPASLLVSSLSSRGGS